MKGIGDYDKIAWKAPELTEGGEFLNELNIDTNHKKHELYSYVFEDAKFIESECV